VTRFILSRLLRAVVVMAGLITFTFFLSRAFSDPARLMLPLTAPEEAYVALRHELGLDQPLLTQFWQYLGDLAHGDLGTSYWQGVPALDLVIDRVPATFVLAFGAIGVAMLVGGTIGTIAGVMPESRIGRLANVLSAAAVAVPDFWLGIILIILFAVELQWLPTSGYGDLQHAILPVLTLSLRPMGRLAQVMRDSVAEEMSNDYVRAARAKGATTQRVVSRHVLKNVFGVAISIIGFDFVAIFTGYAIGVETVFDWPGVGKLAVDAVFNRDVVLVSAIVLFTGALVVVVNAIVDAVQALVDKRVAV
jgi:peptide/nickel transport system permease protein